MSTPFYDLASLVVVPSGYKASKVYAQKPQTTDGQLAFTRASTATRVNASGLVASVATGVPRLDYLNSTCPKLLLEPSRTNMALHSSAFDNAYWTKSNATITANTTISPDGTQNADTVVITAGGYIYAEFFPYSAVSGQSATISVFAKNATSTLLFIGGATTAGTDVYKIENYGNGWYRHSRVRTFTATASTNLQYVIALDGTSIIWGAQVEGSNSAYATSYIPTTTAAVTRAADTSVKTAISSLIGQTEGVIYVEAIHNAIGDTSGADNVAFSIEGSTFNDLVGILYQPNGDIIVIVFAASVLQALITYNVGVTSTPQKMAVAYKNNDFALYVNGVLRGSDTSGTVPTCSNLGLGNYYNGGAPAAVNAKSIKQALLFKTRLTNAQLAELTAI